MQTCNRLPTVLNTFVWFGLTYSSDLHSPPTTHALLDQQGVEPLGWASGHGVYSGLLLHGLIWLYILSLNSSLPCPPDCSIPAIQPGPQLPWDAKMNHAQHCVRPFASSSSAQGGSCQGLGRGRERWSAAVRTTKGSEWRWREQYSVARWRAQAGD